MSWFLPRPLSASCPSSTEVSFLPWTLAPRAAPHLRGLRAGIRDTRWRWCSASLSRSRPARRPWPRPRTPDRADARTALQLRRADAVRRPDRTGLRPAECPPRLRLASRAPEDLRQTTGNAPVERSGERRGGARLGPPWSSPDGTDPVRPPPARPARPGPEAGRQAGAEEVVGPEGAAGFAGSQGVFSAGARPAAFPGAGSLGPKAARELGGERGLGKTRSPACQRARARPEMLPLRFLCLMGLPAA